MPSFYARKIETRSTKQRFIIAVEGEKNEVNYFKAIKANYKGLLYIEVIDVDH